MDALKAQFERIQQQLSALTGTQKMLVAALVAIMVLTMLYWGKYAENPELVSLLGEQTLETADIGPIVDRLESSDVKYVVASGKIMVPADRRAELLAKMMFAHALPSDTHSAFETMSKTLNPFSSNEEREASYSQATANELSDIISRFPGVAAARVVLNSKSESRVEGNVLPSATVFITTRGTPEDVKGLVRAAADGVAHAVSGLTASQISVIVNRESMKVPDSSDGMSTDEMIDQRKAREDELEKKIRRLLHIDGLTVAVNCDVDNQIHDSTQTGYDKKTSLVLPKHTESDSTETVTNMPTPHEPGVGSNTGGGANGPASVDTGGSTGAGNPNTSNVTKEITENDTFPGEHTDKVHTPAGKDKVLSAAVNVPLSYFPDMYKRLKPDAPAPDEKTLVAWRAEELNRIRGVVKSATGLKTEGDVSVDYYADPPVDTTMLAAAVAPVSAMTTVGGHAKEIAIGVLAIVSLFMMATLVRKSSPPQLAMASLAGVGGMGDGGGMASNIPTARSALNSLGSGEDVAGEVGTGTSALDGVEMDDDAVRTQQVLQQVSTMVKENPDGAASLVKRWLTRP
jgi:flagellar biosynthesis/type III secretory pathway M-ring protein FliF/YscJ